MRVLHPCAFFLIALAAIIATPLGAQDKPETPPQRPALPFDIRTPYYMDFAVQLQTHVYGRQEDYFALWELYKDNLETPEEIRVWQQKIRRYAVNCIGGLPQTDAPLNARLCGELDGEGYRIEKIIYESRPGALVTSTLYIPKNLQGKTAAVLFACGHAEQAKAYPEYQAVCRRLARNGLVVLAVDPMGQGERKSYLNEKGEEYVRWGTEEHDYAGQQCWWIGQSIARYFIHDLRRGIDYLESRPEVDSRRIGITGNSGGGTQTTWMMLAEPRLAAAAPATFVMRRRDYMWTGQAQDSEQIIPGGTLNGLDHEDFLISMAPRPTLVLAVDYDFFNIEGTRASVERARRIFKAMGKEENLEMATDRVTHTYSPALARAATEFFCKHLLGKPSDQVDHADPGAPLPVEQLWCTKKGQVLLDHPEAKRAFDSNLETYQSIRKRESDPAAQAKAAEKFLASAVKRFRKPCELSARWPYSDRVGDVSVHQGFWFSEPFMCNAGWFIYNAEKPYEELVIALFDRGTQDLENRRDWVNQQLDAGKAVLAVNARGFGHILPRSISVRAGVEDRYGTIFKFVSDSLCIGDDLASMRIFDLLRVIELAHEDPLIALGQRPVRLYGNGLGGYYAYLAGALDKRPRTVEVEGVFFSADSLIRTRNYKVDRANQLMIFGMAARMDLPDLRPLYEGRELIIRRPFDAEGNEIALK